MRHTLVRAAVLAVLVLSASRVFAVPTGPIAIRTGAWAFGTKAAEPTCTTCHTANALGVPAAINDPSGSLRLLDVPASYAPGTVYTLRVHLEHAWNPAPPDPLRWGFQLQAIQATTGDSAGLWVLTNNVSPDSFKLVKAAATSVYKNRSYLDQAGWPLLSEHPGGPTHYGEVGPVEWHVRWQAPPGDSGKIYFFAAGNSTNGDDACFSSGDFVFTTVESTVAGGAADVPPRATPSSLRTTLATPAPNPALRSTALSFSIGRGGIVDLSIFDLSGRRVRTLMHEFREAGAHASAWDGRNDRGEFCRNGVYFVRLASPDQRAITRKLVLER